MFGGKKTKATASGNQSLIGHGAKLNGDLKFDGDCYIDGMIEGDVSTIESDKAYLSISEGGRVKGNVYVPVLDLSGCIEGDVYVTEKAVFGASARVTGNVHYNLIEIASGAEINGQLIHENAPQSQSVKTEQAAEKPYIKSIAAESAG
jgi:cytoskeletal protein CcmA (bactofilin family)